MTWAPRPRSDIAGLAAISCGAGPSIVLLHGVGLRSEAWNRQIDALSEQYAVTALDMPGHGESRPPTQKMVLSAYTDAVAATLDKPALVVGHSMGAMIALDLAARYPEKVRGIAALNAIFERSRDAAAAVQKRAAQLDDKTAADPGESLKRWFCDTPSPERTACETWLRTVDPAGYKMAYTTFAQGNGPTRDALSALPCPALFMTGQLEPNSTPAMSNAMADLAPDGTAMIVTNAAHMMPMTHATEVNAALSAFAEHVFQ